MKIEKKYLEIPFECINGLIMEPCLKFNSEGLSIKSFTESNSGMCIFNLPKDKFEEYNLEKEEEFKISIELLAKAIKRIKTKFIFLRFEDQRIIISDEKKKEYAIAVMHDEEVKRDVPQLKLESSFNMKSEKFKDLLLDAEVVGDDITLEVNEKLITSSGKLNKFNHEIEMDVIGNAKASYSLDYLNKFLVASKYFKEVSFAFDSDSPCQLSFKGDIEIKFILASLCD